MKKMISILLIFLFTFCLTAKTYAVDEYTFDLQFNGNVVKNIEKNAVVLLTGVNGTLHNNVQIKVEVTGPATPKLLATDSSGVEHDIAQLGYWGPVSGFQVQGSFINTTPIKATFIEEGSYTIKLSLVDVASANAVISSKTFQIEVYEDETPIVNNTVVEELPKTGTSIWEYVLYIGAITIVLTTVGIYFNKRKITNS